VRARSLRFRSQTEVPAEPLFDGMEKTARHPPEIRLLNIPVLNVIGNAISEDVFHARITDVKAVSFEHLAPGNRGTCLSSGASEYKDRQEWRGDSTRDVSHDQADG